MEQEPKTLQEAIVYFSNPANCREYLVVRRWPDGVTCPRCGSKDVIFLAKYGRWHCRAKHKAPQFTLKTGTIMEDSPIPLSKWLTAMWQIVNCRNGISSYEVHRAIGITQKSAWFMDHRIRLALGMGHPPDFLAKSKLMKVSSAARLATCTSRNASAASQELEARIKPSWSASSSAAEESRRPL
jgi:Transposase zinc-ribbon domain